MKKFLYPVILLLIIVGLSLVKYYVDLQEDKSVIENCLHDRYSYLNGDFQVKYKGYDIKGPFYVVGENSNHVKFTLYMSQKTYITENFLEQLYTAQFNKEYPDLFKSAEMITVQPEITPFVSNLKSKRYPANYKEDINQHYIMARFTVSANDSRTFANHVLKFLEETKVINAQFKGVRYLFIGPKMELIVDRNYADEKGIIPASTEEILQRMTTK
ncbi:hypothetical protein GTO91_03400 [Heliobacterium undosum]|uniref:Uncharacterized protein n=1 Tax=Heliomicrobium undosum TaxID=121734 RepID=A0A845L1S1_9FIRM|nr:hypothetical protein [Heliomicrobium undosum]MZP28754.1 hypothetical protein [Heliomicrobium undosum]